jgi:glycosyltransferase involved in cell wall biosynthesis
MSDSVLREWRRYDSTRARSYAACRRLIERFSLQRGAVIGVASGGLCEALLAETGVRELYAVLTSAAEGTIQHSGAGSRGGGHERHKAVNQRLAPLADRCHILHGGQLRAADLPTDLDFVCLDADETTERVGIELPLWGSRVRDNGVMLVYGHSLQGSAEMEREVGALARRFGWQVHDEIKHMRWLQKSAVGVTFIVPTYNYARHVSQAIESILRSNLHKGDELIVVDDASTDGTRETLGQLQRRDPVVQILSHPINKGTAAASRNTGIERASNPIIFCLDADNLLTPQSVEPLRQHLIASGADAAAFGEIHFFRDNPKSVTHKWIFREQVSLADALAGVIWPGPSGNYMFTRESWLRAGRYHEPSLENRSLDSWTFGIRQLGTGSKLICLSGTSYLHRYGHPSQYVENQHRGSQSLAGLIALIPFLELLEPDDVEYIFSQEGRTDWYDRLAEHPLRVIGAAPGMDGTVEYLPRYERQRRREKLVSVAQKVRSRLRR